jgi:hypothetical protein
MPKKSDNAAVETEKGFGTGLRTKLEKRRPGPAEPAESAEGSTAEPALEAEAEAEVEAAVEETSELSETEQLWAELEESLAREEALKLQLAEQAKAHEENRELGRRLAERAEALQQREEELAAQIDAAKAREAEAQADPKSSTPCHGRAYLRQRIEEDGDPLWRVFQEALTATRTNGEPDFRTRLMAASTLLAEAYGDTALLSPGEQVAAARDELAGMRAKRATKPR